MIVIYIPDKISLGEFEMFSECMGQVEYLNTGNVLLLGDFNVPIIYLTHLSEF